MGIENKGSDGRSKRGNHDRPFVTVNKIELCRIVRDDERCNMSVQKLLMMFDLFTENIADAIVEGDEVYLPSFGRFYPIKQASRYREYIYNPYARKKISARNKVFNNKIFKPSKKLIDLMNGTEENDTFKTYFGDILSSDND